LNSSTGEQLQALPGVGPSTAAKIVEYRTEHGGFTSIDELLAVKGIGPKKLEAMRKFLKL
jgi:competence protein ComEA